MLFCGGECGLDWYLPAFACIFPIFPAQLNPALIFRMQLQREPSRRITPLLVASLTYYSPWVREASVAAHTSLFRASSVTQQHLSLGGNAEHKTLLCNTIQSHTHTR